MYKIRVKKYMTQKATENFDFMRKWNNDEPMPMRIMVGDILEETRGMYKMALHADITEKVTPTCMKCGRAITNSVSQYFGMGPECGGHNYVNPFDSDEELQKAVEEYREKLKEIKWTGWVIKSAIEEIADLTKSDKMIKLDDVKLEHKPMCGSASPRTIKVRIDKSVHAFTDNALFVSFEYDSELVNIIREARSKFWNKETKEWELPDTEMEFIKSHFKGHNIQIEGELPRQKPIPYVPEGYKFKTEPFEHQIEGFNYGQAHNRWLLGDEQGLGKTKQVIDIAVSKKMLHHAQHCLIICGVNGLKWNWRNEIKIHSDEKCWILGEKTNKKSDVSIGSNKDKAYDLENIDKLPYFIITNVESLRDENISGWISELCKNGKISMVAVDEIHKCKNPTSQQGKGLLKIQAKYMIAMTGTPLMNNPLDLYIIMKWLGFEKHSFYSFKNHYCVMGGYGGYEIVGYKHMDEIQDNLNAIMLRRLKEDVLDLPEKLYIDEYVEMSDKQAKIYKEISAEIKDNIDQIKIAPNPLAQLIRLRQATGYTGILSSVIQESAKLDRLEELVEELVENKKKVVIFSNWTQITDEVYKRLSKNYYGVVITGETKDEDRQKYINDFQISKPCKFALGTIGAMGTGVTLTEGSVVIFLDHPWNRALYDQAVDRCHRIGQTQNLTIYNLLTKNTIDEKIWSLVKEKGALSDSIVDGKVMANKAEILDYLLS